MIKTVNATRYVTPLREGSSLPAVIEADDGQLYVMKFRGAGQGPKALIAELIAGEIARTLDLSVPELVFISLDEKLPPSEPDPEIQDLLNASVGLNLGMRFLPNALAFNMLLEPEPSARLASSIVWFDAFVTNVDRTPRNVNLLLWEEQLWLIDHGAALYFHHDWNNYKERSRSPFPMIKDHTLLPFAAELEAVNDLYSSSLNESILSEIVDLVPKSWLDEDPPFPDPQEHQQAYIHFLSNRLESAEIFVQEAKDARTALV